MLRSFVNLFAARPRLTLVLWAVMVVFGAFSYTVLMPREGFPAVDIPVAVVSGAYLVDDPERVDADVAAPIAGAVVAEPGVESVESFARATSFGVVVSFDSSITSDEGTAIIEAAIAPLDLPPEAAVSIDRVDGSKFLNEYDLLVGVRGPVSATATELEAAATSLLPVLEAEPDLASVEVVELVSRGIDPNTGQRTEVETGFNLLTTTTDSGVEFRPSIAIGVVAAEDVDALEVRDTTDRVLAAAEEDGVLGSDFDAIVAIDFATQIRQQVGSLQSNVLTGLIAVSIVALLLISWRASVVTALFIVTVLATTVGVLYLVGISLNTISLFGVILALGLFVDDAIVITESIVANRRQGVDDLTVIDTAIARVGTASISGTLTTLLVFAPMLAISGILGEFIRILPISVIVALSVSLILSFTVIPVASRYLVLPASRTGGLLTGAEARLAGLIAGLSAVTGAQRIVRIVLAVGLSIAMTAVGLLVFAPRVGFNIFPPQNDSTLLSGSISYRPGTTIDEARDIALDVNQRAADVLGSELVQGYTFQGSPQSAQSRFSLTDIGGRPTAPELVERLTAVADAYPEARVAFNQISAGPPEATFPFRAQVFGEDLAVAVAAANEIAAELSAATIERPNGTTFQVVETEVVYTDIAARIDGRRLVEVRARFDADDVTTTTTQTQAFVEDRFGADRLGALGLGPDALAFDFGLESENQESFSSLPVAFSLALVSMLVLLVIQFRSTSQWLLVFLAIPFSFFGVFGGLLLTGNVISFFVMLGLIGLIGIAVNNTILLVDFANQERRAGYERGEAVRRAVRHRFRPLVATSLTTVAGLTPLALSDPFWEALGMTIIFGLLSSTFLVLVSFPFYYLAVEAARDRFVTPWRRHRPGPVPSRGGVDDDAVPGREVHEGLVPAPRSGGDAPGTISARSPRPDPDREPRGQTPQPRV
jgi:multidrug efflux pump subunit AcrB